MSNGKTTAPPAALPTPAAPLVCPGDIAISDCKSAMIFSDKAPCFVTAVSPNIHCDFKAVWAFVPPPPAGQLSVLLYFHGHKNWVRMDAGGVCVVPDWAKKGDDIVRQIPDPSDPEPNIAKKRKILAVAQTQVPNSKPPAFVDITCAPVRYQLAASSDANKKPIVLAPENAHPVTHGVECGFDPKAVGALDDLVNDCFTHLNALSKSAACGGTLYLPSKPALTDIKRLFLCGHSGGGVTLFPTAVSKLANDTPTDLCLLDCTYGEGAPQYIEFCRANRAKLGNAAGKWRFLCFHTLDKKTVPQLQDELDKQNEKLIAQGKPPIVKTREELEKQANFSGTQNHVNNDILPGLKALGIKFDAAIPPAGRPRNEGINMTTGSLADIETACTSYPIVVIGVSSVAHDSFANRLIPILLKTANVV
jgi:hypothetical protein